MIRYISADPPGEHERYDVCIIGSGPAGLIACAELADLGARVCVLESGGETRDSLHDALKDVASFGLPIRPTSRERVFGGTSSTWSGLSALFDNIDYMREVPNRWPLGKTELEPYLARAADRFGFPHPRLFSSDDCAACKREKKLVPAWENLEEKVFLRSPKPQRFGRELRHLFRIPEVDLYLGASVHKCVSEAAGEKRRITAVKCIAPDETIVHVRARLFILAGGAIENVRILLNSPAGTAALGNERDQVGRRFMNHPKGYAGTITLSNPIRGWEAYFKKPHGLFVGYAGFRLKEDVQRNRNLLNSYAKIQPLFPWTDRKEIEAVRAFIALCKAYVRPRLGKQSVSRPTASKVIHAAFPALRAAPAFIRLSALRILAGRNPAVRTLRIRYAAEMEPRPENRITLTEKKDRHGLPVARVEYEFSDRDRASLVALRAELKSEFERLGLGTVSEEVSDWLQKVRNDASHHLGGTRMGDDPSVSVVDRNLCVHGTENLFVAGGSVFPTAGCANPTMMIGALSTRLAEHVGRTVLRRSTRSLPPRKGRASVVIIGAGKRVTEDVLPAFEAAESDYVVSAVFARGSRAFFGRLQTYQVLPLSELTAETVKSADIVYVAVPPSEVASVLHLLTAFSCVHVRLVLDTPVTSHEGVDFAAFKSVHVAEDSTELPWIELVRRAAKHGGPLGPIKHLVCQRSVYRYHGMALIKALCAPPHAHAGHISSGFRIFSSLYIKCSETRAVIQEPRNFEHGRLWIEGERGVASDRAEDGRLQISLKREDDRCIGFKLGNMEAALSDAESELMGRIKGHDTIITRMLDIKRVGLLRLLGKFKVGEGWTLKDGVNDAAVDARLHRLNFYIDASRKRGHYGLHTMKKLKRSSAVSLPLDPRSNGRSGDI
jgi:choline dehydrogenase-like flavoprotein